MILRPFWSGLVLAVMISAGFAQTPQHVPATLSAYHLLASEMGYRQAGSDKCGLPAITRAVRTRGALSVQAESALRVLLDRPHLQTSILAGNFRIHFDTTGQNTPAMLNAAHQRIEGTARIFVDSVAAIMGYVYAFETAGLGYPAPPADGVLGGGPELDVYIMDEGSTYGYTTPDQLVIDGGKSTSFITIDNDFSFVLPDSNKGMPALRVTAAHEFHHAVQIGCYGYWTNDVFFYEITSVWMEDVVYPAVNDYLSYLRASWSHFRNPDQTFATNDLIMYSRGIWGKFVEKRFGRDAMKRTWEQVAVARPLDAIDRALSRPEYGSGLGAAYAEWTLWNFFTGSRADSAKYYPEGRLYPEIVQMPREFTPPSTTIDGSLEPLAARYHQVLIQSTPSKRDTLTIAVSNVNVPGALAGAFPLEPYAYDVSVEQKDPLYKLTDAGVYVKLYVTTPINWSSWFIVGSTAHRDAGFLALREGSAFPNPFTPDGRSLVSIPIDGSSPATGTLSVFTSSMDLVYSSPSVQSVGVERQVFTWNGTRNDGAAVASGVYVFVLSLDGDRMVKGKIAVVRK
jgi:hypothetical protein